MSGIKFLADTNAVIYLLSGNDCMLPYLDERMAVSVISFMELLSFPGLSDSEEKSIRQFLGLCEIIQIDEAVREKTIQLRKQNKIKLPDAIIAATAMSHRMTLITADGGFDKIDDLKIEKLLP